MQVFVRDNDVDYALRQLKRKLRREGLFRELKRRRACEKPSGAAGQGENRVDTAATQGAAQAARARGLLAARLLGNRSVLIAIVFVLLLRAPWSEWRLMALAPLIALTSVELESRMLAGLEPSLGTRR